LAIIAFMEAADVSKNAKGARVELAQI
jgi:hypothetical protein